MVPREDLRCLEPRRDRPPLAYTDAYYRRAMRDLLSVCPTSLGIALGSTVGSPATSTLGTRPLWNPSASISSFLGAERGYIGLVCRCLGRPERWSLAVQTGWSNSTRQTFLFGRITITMPRPDSRPKWARLAPTSFRHTALLRAQTRSEPAGIVASSLIRPDAWCSWPRTPSTGGPCIPSTRHAARIRPFHVSVVSIGWGPGLGISTDCDALFELLRIDAIDGRSTLTALTDLEPDLIVVSSPYDEFRDSSYRSEHLVHVAKVAYIPYGIDFGAKPGSMAYVVEQPIVRQAWRIFTSSPARAGQWVEHAGVAADQVVGLGLPVLDQTYSTAGHRPVPFDVQEASARRYKILYTPHWSLDMWSTFLQHGPTLRQLTAEDDDLYVAFRPHPGLGAELEAREVMTKDDFAKIPGTERVYVDSSYEDFFGLLRWADALVSDASSMLFHFAPTGKPIVYLDRVEGSGLGPLSQAWVSKSCEIARSEDGLVSAVRRLRVDPTPSPPFGRISFGRRMRSSSPMAPGAASADISRPSCVEGALSSRPGEELVWGC